ncbi:MAG: hypothetical protein KC592_13710 [Nitrospira sp.]|nr:hypothetical protein [Nitrospira sp.]
MTIFWDIFGASFPHLSEKSNIGIKGDSRQTGYKDSKISIRTSSNISRSCFENLAHGQSPQAPFSTCSNSRINPNLLTQIEPGDLFILCNAGNPVPAYGAVIGGTAATIEFGMSVINVKEIIVPLFLLHSICWITKSITRRSIEVDNGINRKERDGSYNTTGRTSPHHRGDRRHCFN